MQKTQLNGYENWRAKAIAFLGGQTVSMFGSSLVQFAIIWYVARETNSGLNVAISTMCSFVPQTVISLFAGVWADRYSRKKLILWADSSIALSTLILAVLMMFGYNELWLLFLISAIRSAGAGIQAPAVNALIPQIVPEDRLLKVNSVNGSLQSIVNFLSSAAGAAMLVFSKFYVILMIDVATAAIGVGILLFIRIPLHEKALQNEGTQYFADLKEGIKYTLTHPFINRLLILYIVFFILIIPAVFFNPLFVTRVFGDSYWNLMYNEMAFFIGAAVGGMALGIWGGLKNRLHMLIIGSVLFGLLTMAIGFVSVLWIYLVIIALTGLVMPMFNAPVMTLLQEKVESNMQGRVFSLMQIVASVTMLIGTTLFGPAADLVPIQWLMIGSGAMLAVAGIAVMGYKSFIKQGITEIAED